MSTTERTEQLVKTALMIALIVAGTMVIKIPVPVTQGYIHLGDAMIFLGVMLLGRHYGAAAAGLGSALGDILGGFAFWAPWTLIIKFLMAFVMGTFLQNNQSRHGKSQASRSYSVISPVVLLGMTLGGVVMTLGYFIAERVMYGSWSVALVEVPWNIGQFVSGIVISLVIAAALQRTPARRYFAHSK